MPEIARRDVFQAIADPTRRQILSLLAEKDMNLNSIVENFNVSRPAISQQIKILQECGLVKINQEGRERICEVKLESVKDVIKWSEQNIEIWKKRFDKLDNLLEKIQTKTKAK